MKEKIISVSIALVMVLSILSIAFVPTASSSIELPDYEAVDINSGLAGEVPLPSIEDWSSIDPSAGECSGGDTPPVGTTVYDWFLDAMSEGEAYTMTLRAVVGKAEVWVQDDLSFPEDDPRNEFPIDWTLSDEMIEYIAEETDSHIYPTDTEYFGVPLDRYGDDTIFEAMGWPEWTYDWIEVSDPVDPQRIIIKILNYRDDNYYDPTYPYYVAGFFSSGYDSYYDRNMMHIDCWQWWRRVGPEGYQWYPDHPELTVERPFLYDSVFAHEYQHLIHADYNPGDDTFMNEACSMFAEILCYGSYGIAWGHINSYLYTPDNSLNKWGDQGDINILADYGAAQLWATYLNDNYGEEFIGYFVQNGIGGVAGINAALEYFEYDKAFDDVYWEWTLANYLHSAEYSPYTYTTLDLNPATNPDVIPLNVHEVKSKYPSFYGSDFGPTITILGYDTGVIDLAPYSSDYILFTNLKGDAILYFDGGEASEVPYGWMMVDGEWYSDAVNLLNTQIVAEVHVGGSDPWLEIETYWDIEDYWDFGFVQISTDGGVTWNSLEDQEGYITYLHDPSAYWPMVENLPGLTVWSGGAYVTLTFDLSAYADMDVMLGFRYMTDWATLHEGWYISSVTVSGNVVPLESFERVPGYPSYFTVTIVNIEVNDEPAMKVKGIKVLDIDHMDETGQIFIEGEHDEHVLVIVSNPSDPTEFKFGVADYEINIKKMKHKGPRGRMIKSIGTLTMPRWKTELDGHQNWVEGY